MDNKQLKSTDSQDKWIIAKGIQSLIEANLKLIEYCNPEEKQYLICENIAYKKSLDVIRKYIVNQFDSDFLTS